MPFDPSLFVPEQVQGKDGEKFDPSQFTPMPDVKGTNPDTLLRTNREEKISARNTPITDIVEKIMPYVKTGLETIGLAGGAIAATPTGPVGQIAGAGLGYATLKKAGEGIESALGLSPTPTMAESALSSVKDVASGAMMDMGGQAVGPLIGKVGELYQGAPRVIPKELSGVLNQLDELGLTLPTTDVAKAGTPETNEVLRAASMPTTEGLPPLPSAAVVEGEPALSSSLEGSKPNIMALAPKGTDAGSVRPITFGDVEVGYKARVLDPKTGLYQEKYLTKDGKIASGIVPTQDEFGSHLDFVDSTGKVVARTTADSPEAVMKLGQASRLSAYEEAPDLSASFKGGRVSTFTAVDPESGQPTLVVVKPGEAVEGGGAITTSGPAYKLTEDSPIITSPEVDPTLKVVAGIDDHPFAGIVNNLSKGAGRADEPVVPMGSPNLNKDVPLPPSPDYSVFGQYLLRAKSAADYARNYFGVDNFVQDAQSVTMWIKDRAAVYGTWFNELTQGIPSMRDVLTKRLTPIHRQFLADTVEQRFNFNRAVEMAKTAQTPEEFAAWNQARNQANEAFLAAAKDTHAQRSTLLKELAADPNNSSLRINLVLGGEGESLGIKLSPHEQVIVDRMQEFYGLWKGAAEDTGLKTLSGPYARRLYDHDGAFTGARKVLNDFNSQTIGEKEFQERLKGSVDWFPDLQDTTQNYILTAAKRVGWRQWENRWADTLNASPNHIRDYATTLYNDWQGQSSQGIMAKAAEVYRQAESLRLIAYNVGTVIKHAFKIPQTIAHVGFGDTLESLGPLFNAYTGNDPVTKRLIDSFAQFKALNQIAFDDVAPTFNSPASEKLLGFYNKMRQWGTSGIAAMEYFENGLSIVGSALKAARGENFDFQLWRQGMWDTINRCNYRSDIDTPHWMRTNIGRVISLFTYTPLKITTSYAQTAAEAGVDLLNILKGASRHQTELGENWFTVAVRMATMYGVAEGVARASGHTLLPQFAHIPYLSGLKEAWQGGSKVDPALNMPPAIQWASSMKDVGVVHGTVNHWGRDWALWKNAKPLFAPNDFNKQKYDNTGMAILGVQSVNNQGATNPWK